MYALTHEVRGETMFVHGVSLSGSLMVFLSTDSKLAATKFRTLGDANRMMKCIRATQKFNRVEQTIFEAVKIESTPESRRRAARLRQLMAFLEQPFKK